MNEPLDDNLLESLTPKDYKDADIIKCQYQIDIGKLVERLKKYHDYDCLNHSDQVNMLFTYIGKTAYEQVRTQSYIQEYEKLVNRHYDSIDFTKILSSFKNIEMNNQFFEAFQFYTYFEEDCVNIKRYKKILPDRSDYFTTICKILNCGKDFSSYGYCKFHMFENHFE